MKKSKLIVSKRQFKEELQIRIQIAEDILNREINTREEYEKARLAYQSWDDFNLEFLKQAFDNPSNEYRKNYKNEMTYFFSGPISIENDFEELKANINLRLNNLKRLIDKIPLLKTTQIIKEEKVITNDNKVFVVHGHNKGLKLEVARTLEKMGLVPVILHEQPNSGKTIIEKFEIYSDVGFAVILLTDDDLGKAKSEKDLNKRARQNVILELGYFIAKLSRKRVCSLYTNGVELPSDLIGILYVELDESGAWKMQLGKELKACGYQIDFNSVIE